jgi:hypothetical protein
MTAQYSTEEWPLGVIAAFVLLTPLPTIAIRTALTGGAAINDCLVLCPGLAQQHLASQLNNAEYPAVAALTTGYVFRIENPATVFYLQRISQTGALTNLTVTRIEEPINHADSSLISRVWTINSSGAFRSLPYQGIMFLTQIALALLGYLGENNALTVLFLLILVRALNIIAIYLRTAPQWHGQPEPDVNGDLLVLLSQDRWVRLRGPVDDLKATTSGQWLRESTVIGSTLQGAAWLLAHGTAGLAVGMSNRGASIVIGLLVASVALVGLVNARTKVLWMNGCVLEVDRNRGVNKYARRLDMVEQMLREEGRNDEAMRLGLARMGVTVPEKGKSDREARGRDDGAVKM